MQNNSLSIIAVLALPVLLVHGYGEDSHVWDSWQKWLTANHITESKAVTFHKDDQCGTVIDHAAELGQLIHNDKKVNIVAHSKGGLDARWFIAHHHGRVANLIMIATPNDGSLSSYIDLTSCSFKGSAGLSDLWPGSAATQSQDQPSTRYFSVAGNYSFPCYIVTFRPVCYVVQNDGLVTVDSAESHYPVLGVFPVNHTSILTDKGVYDKVLPILARG